MHAKIAIMLTWAISVTCMLGAGTCMLASGNMHVETQHLFLMQKACSPVHIRSHCSLSMCHTPASHWSFVPPTASIRCLRRLSSRVAHAQLVPRRYSLASPAISTGAAPVVFQLDVVPLPPRSSAPTVAAPPRWVDILLDVIGGVESALREECPRTMTGVSQCWFSGHFRQVFFKHQCITPH